MKPTPESDRQCAAAVLMIRPARFGANPETAASNRFQQGGAGADAPREAEREFDGLVAGLVDAGVAVHVADDSPEPAKPDACFPNNWVSFHDDGSVVLYPLLAASRRLERREEAIDVLCAAGYRITRTIDLTCWEQHGEFLEGTGSLVLDRCHRIAYACRSPRTTKAALADFAARLGYRVVGFDARGPAEQAIYHTNVMMAIGARFAVICADAIPDRGERATVLRELEQSGHEPVIISVAQMNSFAGNLLALSAGDGRPLIAMSDAAWHCLAAREQRALERHGAIVTAPIQTIERYGGGSVRCMIAEVFLPR
jgi:hypothetical protein